MPTIFIIFVLLSLLQLSEDIGGVRALAEAGGKLVAGSIKNTLAIGGFEEEFAVLTKVSLPCKRTGVDDS